MESMLNLVKQSNNIDGTDVINNVYLYVHGWDKN